MNCEVKRLTLSDGAPAVKKGGSLSPPAPLSCGAPARRAREGRREAQPRISYSHQTREIPVVPRLMRRFGKVPNHNGEGSALREKSVVCVEIMKRLGEHRYVVAVSPIGRHLLDPHRRKSSIIPRPVDAGVSCSDSSPRLRGTGP